MKRVSIQLIAIVLILSFVVLAAGCSAIRPDFLSEKVIEMLDGYASQDTESTYALLYPGLVDRENYGSIADGIYEYIPVPPEYELIQEEFKYTRGLNTKRDIADARYRIEFDEKVFYTVVEWCSDDSGSGFTTFRIFNEEDWAKAQENK